MRYLRRALPCALAAALIVSGCGSPLDDTVASSSSSGAAPAAAEVLSKFSTMEEPERTDELVKAAQAEGQLNIYGTDDMVELGEAFEAEYGIDVNVYEGDTDVVATRILQEAKGNRYDVDVLNASDVLANQLEDAGLLGQYDSAFRQEVPDEGKSEFWTGYRRQPFVVAYNTDLVDPADIPSDFLEFADPKWQGKLSMELGDYDWYMGLIMYYESKGMSRDEIDEKFRAIASNSTIADGHSSQISALGAGQFAVALSAFIHHVDRMVGDGAPVQWETVDKQAVQPVVMRYEAVALASHAPHPAAATLFMDFVLGPDGAGHIEERGTLPAAPLADDPLDGINVVLLDTDEYATNGPKWANEYDALLRGASS